MFTRVMDLNESREEKRSARTGNPFKSVFGSQQNLRWSRFRDLAPEPMFELIRDKAFTFIKNLGVSDEPGIKDSTYAHHMKDAMFMFPSPGLFQAIIKTWIQKVTITLIEIIADFHRLLDSLLI